MRVLIVGLAAPGSLENSYVRAFRSLGGIDVHHFDVDRYRLIPHGHTLPWRVINRVFAGANTYPIQRALIQECKQHTYDIVLIFKGMEFPRAVLEECRENSRGAFWINLNPDDPLNIGSRGSTNRNVVASLSFFDLYLIWSKRLLPKLREAGCRRVEYLPFAYNPEMHFSVTPKTAKPGSVSFVGAWDMDRERTLAALTDFNLEVYGDSWRRVSAGSALQSKVTSRNLYGTELAEVTAGSAVSLNLLRPQNAGSHNMRTFEIPAMGGLMLTTRSEEQHVWFPEDEACLMYETLDELREKIVFVLGKPEVAQEIRRVGMERVKNHTYRARAEEILGMVG